MTVFFSYQALRVCRAHKSLVNAIIQTEGHLRALGATSSDLAAAMIRIEHTAPGKQAQSVRGAWRAYVTQQCTQQ
jgi:hypothetical protein